MSKQSIQNIKRARIYVTFRPEAPEWFHRFMTDNYVQAMQQLNAVHSSFQTFTVAVAAGANTQAVALQYPFPDDVYVPLVTPDWATTWYVSAISNTGFTIAFGTVAPGGGGVLRGLAVR